MNRRVFWMDARLDYLDCINYDGSGRRTVSHGTFIKHPFALSIFEDFIYYTDWSPNMVSRINKRNGGLKMVFKHSMKKPMDITVVHPALQPSHGAVNYCKDAKCSKLCVLRPKGYACKCPLGQQLKKDNRTCEGMETILKELLLVSDSNARFSLVF